ncbi:hypothetical protein IJJ08_04755 [bacterium]|nr:hypothetical protein [bacterium]
MPNKPRLPTIKYHLHGKSQQLEVAFVDGEVWLTQTQISDLYRLQLSTVNEHLKKITTEDGPYPRSRYMRRLKTAGKDGKIYDVVHYRLEVAEELGRRSRRQA